MSVTTVMYFLNNSHLHYSWILNVAIIIIQILLLKLYFSLKHKKWINLNESYLGMGDILFMLVVAGWFDTYQFLIFLVSSLVFSILVSVSMSCFKRSFNKNIPLVALQGIFALGFQVLIYFNPEFLYTLLINLQ